MGLETAPSNPRSMAWWSWGLSSTWPVTLGSIRFTTLPEGLTMAAATCGWYFVPPLAKVL